MNILVVGATGVLGRNVVPRLVERGHLVRAIVRTHEQANLIEQTGAEPAFGDIFDQATLNRAASACEAVLHIATAVPRPGAPQDWTLNDRIRREGTHNLLSAATNNGVRSYIQQSITFLYGDNGQAIVDESAPLRPTEIIQSAADMEAMVRASTLDWCILRGGTFYGPGTGRDDEWRQDAREGRLLLPGDGSNLVSLTHVVDMARAVVVATEQAPPRSTYNVVDDEPVTYKRLLTYIAAQLKAPAPQPGGTRFLQSLGCTNARIKQELGWQPAYPGYRSGLAYP